MPYIEVRTTATPSSDVCEKVKKSLGKAIAVIPGKSERWLMVEIVPACKLWFAGDAFADSAMVRVAVLGNIDDRDSERMTVEVTKILASELGIAPDRIYISYSEHAMWGWNGSNF